MASNNTASIDLLLLNSAAQVPFAFVTGYGRDGLPDAFATAPVLSKPFSRTELTKLATSLVAARAV
ncbi:MAG: hypothetical protein WAM77_17840 [Xanthobacteraceae bacterium]